MGNASAMGFGLDMQQILKAVGGQLLVAAGSLLLAMSSVRRVHLAESTRSRQAGQADNPELPPPLGKNPMLWKEMFSTNFSPAA